MNQGIKKNLLRTLICGLMLPASAFALEGGHQLELKARAIHWDDDSLSYGTTTRREYSQSALGLQANYQSPYFGDLLGFDASVFHVANLGDSGTPTTSIFEVDNSGQLQDSFTSLAIAAIKLKLGETGEVKAGRLSHNHLLWRASGTRAVPDTASGIAANFSPLSGLQIYGARYDKWRARSSSSFESFRTESTAAGVPNQIKHIDIIGAKYSFDRYTLQGEYLSAKDYLAKYGLVGSYKIPLDKDSLTLSAGLFHSSDAGDLFRCGAERELNCNGTDRIDNDATGMYLDANWKVGNFTLGGAVSKFDGQWIEDNFAAPAKRTGSLNQDHGSNPFPTSSANGPDFTNNDEFAWSPRIGYDWKDHVKGLTTNIKYVKGTGAKSSNLSNLAEGSEEYTEFTIKYALPFTKNLNLSYVYGDYNSQVAGNGATNLVRGLTRQDWQLHRVYLDYSYKF